MTRFKVHQSSLGSWFVITTTPFHVLHIYPQNMWKQAVNAAYEAAMEHRMEATA